MLIPEGHGFDPHCALFNFIILFSTMDWLYGVMPQLHNLKVPEGTFRSVG